MSGASEKIGERATPSVVTVALGERTYDIVIGNGLIDEVGHRIARLRPKAATAIVSDETVAGLHLARLERALAGAGIRSSTGKSVV